MPRGWGPPGQHSGNVPEKGRRFPLPGVARRPPLTRSPTAAPAWPPASAFALGAGSATSTSGSGRRWRPLVCLPARARPRPRVPWLARTGSTASSWPPLGAVGWDPQPSTQTLPHRGRGEGVPNLHPDPSPRPPQILHLILLRHRGSKNDILQ